VGALPHHAPEDRLYCSNGPGELGEKTRLRPHSRNHQFLLAPLQEPLSGWCLPNERWFAKRAATLKIGMQMSSPDSASFVCTPGVVVSRTIFLAGHPSYEARGGPHIYLSVCIAVFSILADVVEVKTGSRSTAHWLNDFIRLNGWLRNSFEQLITPLDIDGIGQNWEDSNISVCLSVHSTNGAPAIGPRTRATMANKWIARAPRISGHSDDQHSKDMSARPDQKHPDQRAAQREAVEMNEGATVI